MKKERKKKKRKEEKKVRTNSSKLVPRRVVTTLLLRIRATHNFNASRAARQDLIASLSQKDGGKLTTRERANWMEFREIRTECVFITRLPMPHTRELLCGRKKKPSQGMIFSSPLETSR